jgi:hypothetical protein
LICHGTKKNDGESGTLFFEDGNRRTKKIQSDVLTHALVSRTPSLVVLQACQSAEVDSSTDLVLGVAETLLRAGIPSVLAFRGKPKINMAYVFMKCLYEHWLVNFDSFEKALTEARMAVQLYTGEAQDKRSVDEWSLPVFYRHSGVNLQIRRGTPPPPDRLADLPNHLAVLVEYLKIVLQSQQTLLSAIHDYLQREGLIEASRSDSNKPDPDRVATLLLAPFSDNPNIPRAARFASFLDDWKFRKKVISGKGQKDALRAIRDTVFLASFPEDDTQEMVQAISNAIDTKAHPKKSSVKIPTMVPDIAKKLGRYAHARLMGQRSGKTENENFLFKLLNEKIDAADTSIIFENKIYKYQFLVEPDRYRRKKSTNGRVEEFAKGCMDQLAELHNPEKGAYTQILKDHVEKDFITRKLYFVMISGPQSPRDIDALAEIMDTFTRIVFIHLKADGNSTIYENIMKEMSKIDLLLTELFQKKS